MGRTLHCTLFIGLLIVLSYGQVDQGQGETQNTYSIVEDNFYEIPAQEKVKITLDLPTAPDEKTGYPNCRLVGKIMQENEEYDINCYVRTPDGRTVFEDKGRYLDVDISTTTSELTLFLDNTYSVMTPKTVYVYLIFVSWEK